MTRARGLNSELLLEIMWSQVVNGFFMIIGKRMTLTIPLPTIAHVVSTKIVNGELVVRLLVQPDSQTVVSAVTLEVADKPSSVDFKGDSGRINRARPCVKSAKRNTSVFSNFNVIARTDSITDTD